MSRRQAVALAVAGALSITAATGCRKRTQSSHESASSALAVGSTAPPIDRLAPGELQPGNETVYGLVLPKGMRLAAHFPGIAHAAGDMRAEDVSNYLRDRVDVQRVELGAVGTVFPTVHIKGGDPSRTYRIEVVAAGDRTEVVFKDVTPIPKKPVDESVPVVERWRRAGLKPDGTPIDQMNLH